MKGLPQSLHRRIFLSLGINFTIWSNCKEESHLKVLSLCLHSWFPLHYGLFCIFENTYNGKSLNTWLTFVASFFSMRFFHIFEEKLKSSVLNHTDYIHKFSCIVKYTTLAYYIGKVNQDKQKRIFTFQYS